MFRLCRLYKIAVSLSAAPHQHFNYIVVGGGTAGCLLANRLAAADPTRRVLLVEAGGDDRWYPWFHVPIGYLFCIGNPRADWMYTTAPCPGLHGRSLRYPRGRVLGGCSAINGMIYMRGQQKDFDSWAAITGDSSWGWDNALELFKKHERHHKGPSPYHGAAGELHVAAQRLQWELLDAFASGAVELGIPRSDDYNTGNNRGVGYFEVTQRDGWRWSSKSAFLSQEFLRNHARNLVITTHRVADCVLWQHESPSVVSSLKSSHPRARGVRVVNSKTREVENFFLDPSDASSEVILAAGALGSPAILMRSGVRPPPTTLHSPSEVEHPLIVPREGVGQNLQDHLQIRTVFETTGLPSLNTLSRNPLKAAAMGVEYALRRTGPLSMAPSQLGIFTDSSRTSSSQPPKDSYPNVEFHVQPLSLDAFGEPLHAFDAITASVCNLNPTSRGCVQLTHPTDPFAPPLLTMNYLSTVEDRRVAAESILLARAIAHETPSFRRHVVREHFPGTDAVPPASATRVDDVLESLASAAGRIATTIFHPVGTCKMGVESDPCAVVDSKLRLIGADGVRIADASVMPLITSGNTNAPTLAIAEMAAQLINAKRPQR